MRKYGFKTIGLLAAGIVTGCIIFAGASVSMNIMRGMMKAGS